MRSFFSGFTMLLIIPERFNSIAIFRDILEYPFHHFLLPHEIHFQEEFFEGNLPFIPPNIKIWIEVRALTHVIVIRLNVQYV